MVWKQHPIYTNYVVSNSGEIRHIKSETSRAVRRDRYGYARVNMVHNERTVTRTVHRLVAETWIPNSFTLDTVNHKDGDKQNNHIDNLEWLSAEDNVRHAFRNGFVGTCHPMQIEGTTYYSKREAKRQTGLSRFAV